jgi:hypothetical protein
MQTMIMFMIFLEHVWNHEPTVFKINFLYVLDCFDTLILKIKFLK